MKKILKLLVSLLALSPLAVSAGIVDPMVVNVLYGPTNSFVVYPHANGFWRNSTAHGRSSFIYPQAVNHQPLGSGGFNGGGAYFYQFDPDATNTTLLGKARNIQEGYDVAADGTLVYVTFDGARAISQVGKMDLKSGINTMIYYPTNGTGSAPLSGSVGVSFDGTKAIINLITNNAGTPQVQTIDTRTAALTTLVTKSFLVNHAHFSPYDSSWVSFAHEGNPVNDRCWAWNAISAPNGINLFSSSTLSIGHERAMYHKAGVVAVAYPYSTGSPRGVYEFDFDLTSQNILNNNTVYHVNLSRDGKWGVFETLPGSPPNYSGPSSIVIFNYATGAIKTLYDNVGSDFLPYQPDPSISPDGNWIIFNDLYAQRWVAIKLDQAKLRSFVSVSVPAAPAALSAATMSSSTINLNWTASSGFPSYYNVKYSTTSGGPYSFVNNCVIPINYGSSSVNFSVTNLSPGTKYYFIVTGANTGGEGVASPEATATTSALSPPLTPGGVVVTPGNGNVGLMWNSSTNASSYFVKRATVSGGPYSVVASGLTAMNYLDTGLANGVTYYYEVSATNSAGESGNSMQVGATAAGSMLISESFNTNSAAVTGRVPLEATIAGRACQAVPANTGYANYASNGMATVVGNMGEAISIVSGGGYTKPGKLTITATFDPEFLTAERPVCNPGRGFYLGFWSAIPASGDSEGNMRGVMVNPDSGNLVLWNGSANAASAGVQTNHLNGDWSRFARMVHTMTYTIDTTSGDITSFFFDGESYSWNPTTIFSDANTAYAGFGVSGYGSDNYAYVHSWSLRDSSLDGPTGLGAHVASDTQINLAWFSTNTVTYTVKRANLSGGPYTVIASGISGGGYQDTNVITGNIYHYVVSAISGGGESADSADAYSITADTIIVQDNFDTASPTVTGRYTDTASARSAIYQMAPSTSPYANTVHDGVCYLTGNIGETIDISSGWGYTQPTNVSISMIFYENTVNNSPVYQARGCYAGFWNAIPGSGDSEGNMRGVFVNPDTGRLVLWNGDSNPGHSGVQTLNYNGTWSGGTTKHTMSYTVNTVSGNIFNFVLDGTSYTWSPTTIFTNVNVHYAGIGVSSSSTSGQGWFGTWTVSDGTVQPPTGLVAYPGNAQVTLDWTDSLGAAASYSVKRATTSGGPYTVVASGVTATGYTSTGLANGTTYYFVISATNSMTGDSGNSLEVSATPSAGILIQDTFRTNSTPLIGRVPEEANILGRSYQLAASGSPYTNYVSGDIATMAVNVAGVIPIGNGTGYTKPTNLTIQARFQEGSLNENSSRNPGRGCYAGFWSSIPSGFESEANFYGVFVNPDNGNLVLWNGSNNAGSPGLQTLAYQGNWVGGSAWHTMSYVVNTVNGNITNFVLDGISYIWSPTTIFTNANTAYAGIGVSGASTSNDYGYFDSWSLEDASIVSPPVGTRGMAIPVTPGSETVVVGPNELKGATAENSFTLNFKGAANASYSVWSSTNLIDWHRIGAATEVDAGQYQFEDAECTNYQSRFYRISTP